MSEEGNLARKESNASSPETVAHNASAPLAESITIMARLRAPGGCPWDREQTFDTIKRYTLEETYEVFEAIERRAWPDLKDELGDLLLQVLFYAQMAAEAGYFDIADVAENLNAKLIRRHPHVFPQSDTGELVDANDSKTVLRNWEQIKAEEKRVARENAGVPPMRSLGGMAQEPPATSTSATPSSLDDIPRTMPAAMEAHKLGSRAAKVGFDWPDAAGILAKLDEEIAELRAEIRSDGADKQTRIEEEFGDLMFTAINLARHLKIDSESALRAANAKFRSRFRRRGSQCRRLRRSQRAHVSAA